MHSKLYTRIVQRKNGETMVVSKISKKYLTSVPAEIRKAFALKAGDELDWLPMGTEILVRPRKRKHVSLSSLIGILETRPTNVTRDHDRTLYGAE